MAGINEAPPPPPPSVLKRSLSQGAPTRVVAGGVQMSQPSPTLSQKSGPTFFSLMASKRLAKQFASKVYARRFAGSSSLSSKYGTTDMEASYRMEPKDKFDGPRVEEAMEDIVEHRMKDFRYSARRSVMMSKIITEEIKERVKEMNFDRYKIVCVVNVGEIRNQGLRVTSRCLWDNHLDKSCTYNWKSGPAFCCATVYGLYHE